MLFQGWVSVKTRTTHRLGGGGVGLGFEAGACFGMLAGCIVCGGMCILCVHAVGAEAEGVGLWGWGEFLNMVLYLL